MKVCARLAVVEYNLCHCGKENKRPTSPLLGSPIVLSGPLASSSEKSFHSSSDHATTTAVSSESSVPSSSNDELTIYDSDQLRLIEIDEDPKENEVVLYDSATSHLVEIVKDPVENMTPIPVPAPTIDLEGIRRLTVRGQRAIRSAGHPKSTFHPYSRCCAIGPRSSTHGIGYPCSRLPADRDEQSLEGGVETQGWGYES